jgi:hypothetical protein
MENTFRNNDQERRRIRRGQRGHPSDGTILALLVRMTAMFTEAGRRFGVACKGLVDAIVAHIACFAAEREPAGRLC